MPTRRSRPTPAGTGAGAAVPAGELRTRSCTGRDQSRRSGRRGVSAWPWPVPRWAEVLAPRVISSRLRRLGPGLGRRPRIGGRHSEAFVPERYPLPSFSNAVPMIVRVGLSSGPQHCPKWLAWSTYTALGRPWRSRHSTKRPCSNPLVASSCSAISTRSGGPRSSSHARTELSHWSSSPRAARRGRRLQCFARLRLRVRNPAWTHPQGGTDPPRG